MATGINISNYAENLILQFMLRTDAITRPSAWYASIYSDAGGLTTDQPTQELSGNGYSRQPVSFTAPAGGSCSNSNLVAFQATGNWASANYLGITDSLTGGNLLFWGEFANKYSLEAAGEILFAANTINISID